MPWKITDPQIMEDDPVVAEHRVFISTHLTPYLHIVQLPSRPDMPQAPEGSQESVKFAARYKKVSRVLELEVPLDTHHPTYSEVRGTDFGAAATQGTIKVAGGGLGASSVTQAKALNTVTLAGGPVRSLNASYFAGVFRDGDLYMTPVESVLQLRPTLNYLDERDSRNKTTNKKLADAEKPSSDEVKAIAPQFKRKETEEQVAARLNSYTFLKRQVDDEAWTGLSHFPRTTQEADKVAQRLAFELTPEAEGALEFAPEQPQNYLDLYM